MRVFVVCALLFTGSDDHLGIGLFFFVCFFVAAND